MKHLVNRPARSGLALVCLASVLGTGAATAQLKKPPSIEGHWRFQTSEIPNKGCSISGEIDFRQTSGSSYSCTFVSNEVCGRPEDGNVSEVKQSCSAAFSGLELSITSKVDQIVQVPRGVINYSYKADNFFVKPQPNGEMLGHFTSINQAPVKFWRTEALIS